MKLALYGFLFTSSFILTWIILTLTIGALGTMSSKLEAASMDDVVREINNRNIAPLEQVLTDASSDVW